MDKLVKLYELKVGEKFYNPDNNLIYVLWGCKFDMNDPDCIEWRGKIWKTSDIPETRRITGLGVRDREYYKYTGRDSSSYYAGFRAAMNICLEHMGSIDKQNAGISDDFQQFMTMHEQYKLWIKNLLP